MSRAAARSRYTYDEYRRFEEATDAKHEYIDGEILAMAGGTPEPAALAAAVIAEVSRQLAGGPCTIFSSDLRVRIRDSGVATYPDATVICGELERDPEDPKAAANPMVLIEVLSDSTAAYDAGEKFAHYSRISTLREYVLVSHRERRIEVRWRVAESAWQTSVAGRSGAVHLASIGVDLAVDVVYEHSPLTALL
jgi:Uma2 family endonuclease